MKAEWHGTFGRIHLRLRAREDGIIQVTRDLTGTFRTNRFSPVCPRGAGSWEQRSEADGEVFALPGLQIRVSRENGALSFLDESGKLLLRERPEGPAELQEAEIRLSVFDEKANIREETGADGVRTRAEAADSRPDRIGVRGRQHFCFQEGEALYGLGSHEEGTGNLRGHTRLLYQHNLKAVVPVLVSTTGWGILFDQGCLMRFQDDGKGSFLEIDCADALDWYFCYGDGSYASLMEKMRALTGPAPLLPRYALGFAQSKERYETAEELTAVAAEYRRRKIPLDLMVQDWQTWPAGQWGLKRFDRSRFPRGFTDRLHGLHVRVMLSVWPHMQGEENSDRQEMLREGCMLGNRSTYDAFSLRARELYFRQLREGLLGDGIDAWWCDCTEPFEADWSGSVRPSDEERLRVNTAEAKKYLDPAEISLYSLFHSQGIYEGLRKTGPQRVLNLTRSSWAGQCRYGAVTWSGDVCASWEMLRRHVPEGLNFMATGEAYWNCDIGGFFSAERDSWFWKGEYPRGAEDPGYRELVVRWMQYACFLTLMRAHGTDTPREIWRFGEEGEPFYDAIALCIRMRYRLLAYQYALMAETHRCGIPAVRIPALVFPGDRRLREINHEMMLGDALLVCPVTRPMGGPAGGEKAEIPAETVEVYLPAGCRWYSPDGEQQYEGGQTVTVPAPLDRIPVFVRAGSILPVSPARQYTEEATEEATEIRIYPGADGAFALYDDDGITYAYEQGACQRIPVSWNDREGVLTLDPQEGSLENEQFLRIRRMDTGSRQEVRYTGKRLSVRC